MSTKIPSFGTAEQLLAAPAGLGPCELVRGELIMMTPAGEEHSRIEARLFLALANHVLPRQLGQVYTGDAGFLMERNPDTVRAPDVAFVRTSRLSKTPYKGFFPGPPDLAVEIRSPEDRPSAIAEKIEDYLRLGVQVVWDVAPEERTVTIHRTGERPQCLTQEETLADPGLLPGFEIPVRVLFDW